MGGRAWWHTPVISALGRLRQEDQCEFETNLGYKSQLKASLNCTGDPVSEKKKERKKRNNNAIVSKDISTAQISIWYEIFSTSGKIPSSGIAELNGISSSTF